VEQSLLVLGEWHGSSSGTAVVGAGCSRLPPGPAGGPALGSSHQGYDPDGPATTRCVFTSSARRNAAPPADIWRRSAGSTGGGEPAGHRHRKWTNSRPKFFESFSTR